MDTQRSHQRQVVHNPVAAGDYSLQLAELGPEEKRHYGQDAIALVPRFRKPQGIAFPWSNVTPPSAVPVEPHTPRTPISPTESNNRQPARDTRARPFTTSIIPMPGLSPDLDTHIPSPELGGPETPPNNVPSAGSQEQEASRFHAARTDLENPIGLNIEEQSAAQTHTQTQLERAEYEPIQPPRMRLKVVSRPADAPPSGIPADWGADAPNRRDKIPEENDGGESDGETPNSDSNSEINGFNQSNTNDKDNDENESQNESIGDDEDGNGSKGQGSRANTPGTFIGTQSAVSSSTSEPQTGGLSPGNFGPELDFANLVGVAENASAGGRRTRSSRLRIPRVVSHPIGSALSAASLKRGGTGIVPSTKSSLRSLRLASDPTPEAHHPRRFEGSRSASESSSQGFHLQFGVPASRPGGDRAYLQAQAKLLARARANAEPLPWETEAENEKEPRSKMYEPWPAIQTDLHGRSASEKVIWARGDDLDDNPVLAGPAPWVSFPHAPLMINGQLCDAWGRKECSVERAVMLLAAFCLFPPGWLLMGAGAMDTFVGVVPQYVKLLALGLGGATLVAMILCATLVSLL